MVLHEYVLQIIKDVKGQNNVFICCIMTNTIIDEGLTKPSWACKSRNEKEALNMQSTSR